ncbi:MAG: 30S ribosomal protein S24e [Nanoarchaeota archaeon]
MEIKIITQKENPLLARKEIVAELTLEGATPKRTEAAEKIATALKTTVDTVTIRNLVMTFGGIIAKVTADVYKSAEDRKKYEGKRFRIKGQPRQATDKK